jgi:predicted RNA methylase
VVPAVLRLEAEQGRNYEERLSVCDAQAEGEEMKVDNTVLNVLSNALMDGPRLVLTGQLDRALYTQTNKVLEAAGGKWDRKAKAHVFPVDAADAMEQIIQTGEVTLIRTIQQDFGYFPTPEPVLRRLIQIADLESGMLVLEPSAGKGAIAYHCADMLCVVDCVELLDANYVALAGDPRLGKVQKADFLAIEPSPLYDRVVMNPPFAKQADIHHVKHALKFLKPDGLLVSVMSASVTFRDNKLTQDFRDLVRARDGDIEALPDGAFKESGTGVRTVIVTIPAEAA